MLRRSLSFVSALCSRRITPDSIAARSAKFTFVVIQNPRRFCSTLPNEKPESRQRLTKVESKIALGFTCKPCGQRVNRLISRIAYTKGLVLIRCPNCKNVHLIADNIGWFEGLAPGAKNIEGILAQKGESVRKQLETDEVFEIGDFPAANPVKDPAV